VWVIGLVLAAPAVAAAAPCVSTGPAFAVDGLTCQLAGVYTFTSVSLTNGATVEVVPYTGGDKRLTGSLELRAPTITIDASSRIVARGAGYQTAICGDGQGPNGAAGGRGGCAVRDSGGGGAHFGRGGRGTKDITGTQSFPRDFEESCGNSVVYNASGVPSCSVITDCRSGNDGLPTVAGTEFFHSIYQSEFGASGGDKGCRDGDGTSTKTAGPGGGRIVLAALDATQTGALSIAGRVDTNGRRGCGDGNDSAGGGAGGTIFLVGDNVAIAATARITAAGGLGGDTQGLAADPTGECTAPAQQGGTCDDCGGGGGGGLISVLSVNGAIADESVFNVGGALGGTCAICQGEAGGGVGELQISGGYVGEFCDGYDNDFDDAIDEDLAPLLCAGGPMPSCVAGVPQLCPVDTPACVGPVTDTRARFMVVVDTSGSMLGSLSGVPTFGDGSIGHAGLDQDGNGVADDSRLYKAKGALSTVIAAYPEIDFALARYHQDTAVDRSCQVAGWFECGSICCSYDDPTNNTGTALCNVDGGALGSIPVRPTSPGDECVNYAGNCGPPRRGADVLVGFGSDLDRHLSWLDGRETNYNAGQVVGDYCANGDCELRGTGPTPLANSLAAAADYLAPIKACDAAASGGCRRYGTILLTDGAESCQGDPVAAAVALRALGIDTFVVGFSVLASEEAQLNSIATAGGTGAAFLVGSEDDLANALATIVSGSIVFETCNQRDDDCDLRVDEGFPDKDLPCDDGDLGACLGTGTYLCADDGSGTVCAITDAGASPMPEICNGLDDDCDGAIDDGISCIPGCVPTSTVDLCNGLDDDCDGAFDEDDPAIGQSCGTSDLAPCQLGEQACIGGMIVCVGAIEPGVESCNGLDDDCDGNPDDQAACPGATSCVEGGCRVPCESGEFPCPGGLTCAQTPAGDFCVPDACAACTATEICQANGCVDPCAGITCAGSQTCRLGTCVDCDVTGCVGDQICVASECVADPCGEVDCAATCTDVLGCSCYDGACRGNCVDTGCPSGQRCDAQGACVVDACAEVTCPTREVCANGACVADPCNGVSCGPGAVCTGGTCIDDPCKVVDCGPSYRCEVRTGEAVCVVASPAQRPELVTAAGGGCSTGGEGGAGALLMVLGFAWARRRRAS